jgi:twitching motility two-component system response regulator PilH
MVQKPRILIADDDTEIRLGAAELIGPLGLEIVQAATGLEALDVLRERSVQLALLDVHMPGRTGIELLEIVRDETIEVPCIFWSGEADDVTAKWLLDRGADAFLKKPVRPADLRDTVRETLGRHGFDPAA